MHEIRVTLQSESEKVRMYEKLESELDAAKGRNPFPIAGILVITLWLVLFFSFFFAAYELVKHWRATGKTGTADTAAAAIQPKLPPVHRGT